MATPVSNVINPPSPAGNGTLTDEFIYGLVQGSVWTFGDGPRVLTYSLSLPDGFVIDPGGGAWTESLSSAFGRALAAWSVVANVGFAEAGSGTVFLDSTADLSVTLTGSDLQADGGVALGFFPDPAFADLLLAELEITRLEYARPEGDLFFDNFYSGFSYLNDGGIGFEIMMHEIGHALGLKHPDDDGGNGRPTFGELGILPYDASRYTIMTAGITPGANDSFGNAATPMPLDILAIQQIYGPNTTSHIGNDAYTPVSGAMRTVWDAGGTDTLDASGYFNATIDLRPGAIMDFGPGTVLALAYDAFMPGVALIENAIGGAGNDTIHGNGAANVLAGGGGRDTLYGGAGDDSYVIGAGDSSPATFLSIRGEAGDWVSQGNSYYYEAGMGTFFPGASDQSFPFDGPIDTVGVSFLGPESSGVSWSLVFSTAGLGIPMQAGVYPDAVRQIFGLAGHPGMDVSGNGRGSNQLTGNFTVHAASFDTSGPTVQVLDLFVTFEQHSEGAVPGLFGALAFNHAGGVAADEIVEQPNAGIDTVLSAVNIVLPANVENLGLTGLENLTGVGNALNNVLAGNDANNSLIGGEGNDALNGGAGADTASYAGATGAVTAEIWKGTAINDGQGGADTLAGIENLIGGGFNDLLVGNEGVNNLNGGNGNDVLLGGGGVDTLVGRAGNDWLQGGAGSDALDGGADTDTADYATAVGNVEAEIWKGTASNDGQGGADTLLFVENLLGGAFNDLLAGNEGANTLNGANGNDQIYAGGGADTLIGGAGNDRLAGGAGNDALNGGADADTADYTSGTGAVTVEIWKGTASNDGQGGADTLLSIESLLGGAFNDLLAGNEGANTLNGANGDDQLYGGGGDDSLIGGGGDDRLAGNAGSDLLNGGTGADTADYATASGNVTAEIWKGTASNDGQGGADTLVGIENATGGAFNDLLVGNEGANVLNGAAGNDVLLGGGGVDTLLGGAGNDTLSGGNGNDTLTGGANQDLFLFANAPGAGNIDTITDFNVVDDTIQLENAIFTSLATPGALAAGSLFSGAGFTTSPDPISSVNGDYLVYDTATGALYYDADGNNGGFSKQIANLLGAPALTAADFQIV